MAKEHKKYTLSYCSGATGYGWKSDCDRLDECESFIDELRSEYTANVSLWDNTTHEYVYRKKALTYKPDIDLLYKFGRDMRTKTRQWK